MTELDVNKPALRSGPLISASILLGVGMGGFIDGIVLHQILQWHQMISNVLPPLNFLAKSVNMFWDGIFHAFTWIMTFLGIILLWNISFRIDVIKSNLVFMGGLILGWGIFNTLDSIFNHYLFKLHNVKEISDNQGAWNLGFLILAVLFMLAGWFLIIRGKRS